MASATVLVVAMMLALAGSAMVASVLPVDETAWLQTARADDCVMVNPDGTVTMHPENCTP